MAELRPHIPEIREAGAEVVVVGSGWPAAAEEFRRLMELPDLRVLCDSKRESYQILAMKRGIGALLDPRALVAYVRALASGFKQGKTQGDAMQQGGIVVVASDGAIRYRYVSRFTGDHAPVSAVVSAVKQAGGK